MAELKFTKFLNREIKNYPWPKTIGIDEHFFSRRNGYREFATVVVDFNNKRVRELARGKNIFDLERQLAHIPGRGNVKQVALDLSDPYKSFALQFFPNAKLINVRECLVQSRVCRWTLGF